MVKYQYTPTKITYSMMSHYMPLHATDIFIKATATRLAQIH